MKAIKCPKCRAKNLVLTELWHNHAIEFEYENGAITSRGSLSEGDPYKVDAWCKSCDHTWTLRGVTQITDVTKPKQ